MDSNDLEKIINKQTVVEESYDDPILAMLEDGTQDNPNNNGNTLNMDDAANNDAGNDANATGDTSDYDTDDGSDAGDNDDAATDDQNNNTNEDNQNTDDNTDNQDDNNTDDQEDNADYDIDDSGNGDDNTDDGNMEDDNTDDQNTDDTSDKAVLDAMYDKLTPEEKKMKDETLKKQFKDLYEICGDLIEKINMVDKSSAAMSPIIKNVMSSLMDFQVYIQYYLTDVYATKSYIENDIEFNKYLQVFNGIKNIIIQLDDVISKQQKNTTVDEEKKEDKQNLQ